MLFNSYSFLLFFIIVTTAYFLCAHRFRWIVLLTASCIFYMFFIPIFIFILIGTIIIDYFAGLWIEKAQGKRRKAFLVLSILANVGVLCFFKYGNFFLENVKVIAELISWNYSLDALMIILPIGLSFHTFQALSYTIEVYRGRQKAERHFGVYALYVMYYPQLVAGPIERPQNLLPQFHRKHSFDYSMVSDGLKQMIWGFFKKIVIADRMASFINPVYNDPAAYDGTTLLMATLFFSFQVFCDFSGYSDIALGASKVMGIRLMQNFRSPYFADSISDFWKRWHISLSTWFKDYLYIPLGGNKLGRMRWYFNLMIVFMVSGFWHGANWTYIAWGTLHGMYLILALLTKSYRTTLAKSIGLYSIPRFHKILNILLVFTLVNLAWIFFRAENLSDAFFILNKIILDVPIYVFHSLSDSAFLWLEPLIFNKDIGLYYDEFLLLIAAVVLMESVHFIELRTNFIEWINKKATALRWTFYICLIYFILFFGSFHNSSEFIYFQF